VRAWVTEAVNRHPAAYQEVAELLDMAQRYIRKPPPLMTAEAGIELKIAIKLVGFSPDQKPLFDECDYDDPGAFARGRADILGTSDPARSPVVATVYDHKTQPNVEDADTFQMGFYAWVISKTHPYLDEIRTVLHFARYGKYSRPYVWRKDGRVYEGEDPREIGDLRAIEDQIMARVAIIESRQVWEAVPHKNCQYCPFIAECPALAEYIEVSEGGDYRVKSRNLKILGSTDKAVKIAGLINVLEEMVKEAKKNLKDHVKEFGPIAIPGKIYQFAASEEKIDWDIVNKKLRPQVYQICEKYGLDPRALMGFSQTFSKHILTLDLGEDAAGGDKTEAFLKELAPILPRTIDTEFRGVKA
jgi:hypothetical protein